MCIYMRLWLIYVQFLVPRCPGSCPLWWSSSFPSCQSCHRTCQSCQRDLDSGWLDTGCYDSHDPFKPFASAFLVFVHTNLAHLRLSSFPRRQLQNNRCSPLHQPSKPCSTKMTSSSPSLLNITILKPFIRVIFTSANHNRAQFLPQKSSRFPQSFLAFIVSPSRGYL